MGEGGGGAYSVFLSPNCNLLTKATNFKENQSYLYFVSIDLDLTT